ncbi:MAG TPA: CbtA family protein [Acetobacteraceae bacterium]|nr:CbtA family protein [Acetobacteraceae bacterium]
MSVFRSIVFAAVLSGLLVGCFVTIAQHIATVPLILKAEVYEQQAQHGHEDEGWQPANGFERNAYTALFNLVDWIGFALLLNGAIVLLRRPVTWREGLLWGLGGFIAFVIAPGLGLAPELPGVPAAGLLLRQLWWTATVVATACGLGLIAFRHSAASAVAAILLIAAPHLVGAPRLEHVETNVPEALSRQFTVAVTLTALPCWALLGALTCHFYRWFSRAADVRPAHLPSA